MKKLLSVLLSGLMIFALVGCGSSTSDDKKKAEEDKGPKTYEVGQTVELKDLKFTVNKVYTIQSANQFIKPNDGNDFIGIDCTVENTSDSEKSISSIMMFKVVDKDGRDINMSFTGVTAAAAGQLDGSVGAGRKMTGVYAVEVPKGTTGLELEFNADIISSKRVIIKLN